jgi:hypothetical protein
MHRHANPNKTSTIPLSIHLYETLAGPIGVLIIIRFCDRPSPQQWTGIIAARQAFGLC